MLESGIALAEEEDIRCLAQKQKQIGGVRAGFTI